MAARNNGIDLSHVIWNQYPTREKLDAAWKGNSRKRDRLFTTDAGVDIGKWKILRSKMVFPATFTYSYDGKILIWTEELSKLYRVDPITNWSTVGRADVAALLDGYLLVGDAGTREQRTRELQVERVKQEKLDCQAALQRLEQQLGEFTTQEEEAQQATGDVSTTVAMQQSLAFAEAAKAYATCIADVRRTDDASPKFTVAYQTAQLVSELMSTATTRMLYGPQAITALASEIQVSTPLPLNDPLRHSYRRQQDDMASPVYARRASTTTHSPSALANARREGAAMAFEYSGLIVRGLIAGGQLSATSGRSTRVLLAEAALNYGLFLRVVNKYLGAVGDYSIGSCPESQLIAPGKLVNKTSRGFTSSAFADAGRVLSSHLAVGFETILWTWMMKRSKRVVKEAFAKLIKDGKYLVLLFSCTLDSALVFVTGMINDVAQCGFDLQSMMAISQDEYQGCKVVIRMGSLSAVTSILIYGRSMLSCWRRCLKREELRDLTRRRIHESGYWG
jgi:hypothetical protein